MARPATDSEIGAAMNQDLWATCDHIGVGVQDHRCPRCLATMRRCCDSSIGRDHRSRCPTKADATETSAAPQEVDVS